MKTINYSKNLALAAVAAMCVTTFAMGAHADESNTAATARTVHYSDLNLNTQTGAEALYHRIRSAAERVCGDVDSRQLVESAAVKACVNQAVSASVRAVNSRRLTIAYNERAGVVETTVNLAAAR